VRRVRRGQPAATPEPAAHPHGQGFPRRPHRAPAPPYTELTAKPAVALRRAFVARLRSTQR
jgi:hypothetical protein